MISLLALFFIGCLIVVLSVLAVFRMPARETGNLQVVQVELYELIELRALRFKNFSRLFSDADYRHLCSEPRLVRSAQLLRKDRRRLALRWLAALRSDVLSLWRLRRLLTDYKISQGSGTELSMHFTAAFLLASIAALRLAVFLFGPFAFSAVAYKIRRYIETYTRCCRAALGRLPRHKLDEFSAAWRTRQVAA